MKDGKFTTTNSFLLTGGGVIDITGTDTTGSDVEFQSTMLTTRFTGTFNVHDYGILNLSTIATPTFGVTLSGHGKHANAAAAALRSLDIDGDVIPNGTCAYTNFTPAQRAFRLNNGGSITVVSTTNPAPTLAAVRNRTLLADQTLVITNVATDADVPAQTLTFSLLTPRLAWSSMRAWHLFWRPTMAQASGIYPITVKVADNGAHGLSATNGFSVMVSPPAPPAISVPALTDVGFSFAVTGDSGPDYTVLISSRLATWSAAWTNRSPVLPFSYTNAVTNFRQLFYPVRLGPWDQIVLLPLPEREFVHRLSEVKFNPNKSPLGVMVNSDGL